MSQDYNLIGELAPDAGRVPHHIWDGVAGAAAPPVDPIDQAESPFGSAFEDRGNTQRQAGDPGNYAAGLYHGGDRIDSWADYEQTPAAATTTTSYPQAADGQIPGAA